MVCRAAAAPDAAPAAPAAAPDTAPPVVRVDGLVVQPTYRSTPWEAEAQHAASARDKARIMFVSESGICRAPLAAAAFEQLLQDSPLGAWVEVHARATRDYCEGQPPHAATAAAARALGIRLPGDDHSSSSSSSSSGRAELPAQAAGDEDAAAAARVFDPAGDIVAADLVLVMDKYTAADVLREVSSYDLINPGGHYSARVRLLGSFHPALASRAHIPDGQDIDDPLYGNEGGEEEQADVLEVSKVIVESCRNLLEQLTDLAASHGMLPGGAAAAAAGAGAAAGAAAAGAAAAGAAAAGAAAAGAAAAGAAAAGAAAGGGAGSSEGSSSEGSSSDGSGGGSSPGAAFRQLLVSHVRQAGVIDWLVPPMLQGSNTDLGGWV